MSGAHVSWLCIGDFNEMSSQMEKEEISPIEDRRINFFITLMNNTELMDMDLKRCKFTCVSNPRDGMVTKEKFDRILVN